MIKIKHRFPQVEQDEAVQAVLKALDVLEYFSQTPRPASLGKISAQTGINKSTLQRITRTLASRGYLAQDESGVRLGAMLLDRGFDYLRSNPLVERASPILTDLRRETGERVDLSLFDPHHDNLSIIYAVRMQSRRETFYATLPGRRFPAASASGGRACMAMLADEIVDDILNNSELTQMTARTVIEHAEIKQKIQFARENGYTFSVEEALLGEIVLAAAIADNKGNPVGAIHIASSLSQWTVEDFCDRFAPLAMSAARAASAV